MTAQEFWSWFESAAEELRSATAEDAADRVYPKLAAYDDRLGVEVSREDERSEREMVVTAYGDSAAFNSVETLIRQARACSGWRFCALKPPQGFDFAITIGTLKIQAGLLSFEPLKSAQNPTTLGIRTYVPKEVIHSAQLQETIELALQTGVGEKRFAMIGYIEVQPVKGSADGVLSIQQLARYIDWHQGRAGVDGAEQNEGGCQ